MKKPIEHTTHVLMKAFIWALYLPEYPDLAVEIPIGDRYKPDVVQLDAQASPLFWGEAGKVSPQKIRSLVRRYPHTHFAIAKWDSALDHVADIVGEAVSKVRRNAPFDLISLPEDSADKFIDQQGNITITFDDIPLVRLK